MERITVRHLHPLVARINRELGMPAEPWTKRDAEGKIHANIGNYHLDGAYGGWALEQMVGEGGGTRRVIDRGTARELRNALFAFIEGYDRTRAIDALRVLRDVAALADGQGQNNLSMVAGEARQILAKVGQGL